MSHKKAFEQCCLVNGIDQDKLSIADRGLQYGDGLFETIKIVDGQAEFWNRHMLRLEEGCKRLGIEPFNRLLIEEEAAALCLGQDKAVLKIIVTRGAGGRGYHCPESSSPTRILSLSAMPDYKPEQQQAGVALRLCEQRLSINPALAGIKHLNRLEQVMARREWDDSMVFEGLMKDMAGNVVEGVMSNLFIISQGRLLTADLSRAGVCGIMRSVIIDIAQHLNIEVSLQDISWSQLLLADEVFICNSLMGIVPVASIDKKSFSLGAMTQMLIGHLINKDKELGLYN